MNPVPLLEAHALARSYGGRVAVREVDLTVRAGEVVGLLGLNGAGKSTTLRMLTGVLAPHHGTVRIAGLDLARSPLQAKRQVGYLPEIPPLYPDLSVDEYLALCAGLHEIPVLSRAAAVAQAKARCNLSAVGQRLIRHLSRGTQQRVGIAQAIIHQPAVLILDEPTVGLDPAQQSEVRALISTLSTGRAILLSTHLLNEAEALCSRAAILHQGRIVYDAALASEAHLTVTLRAPPDVQVLRELPGVAAITVLSRHRFVLEVADLAHTAEQLVALAVAQQWGLQELARSGSALAQTFLKLTRDDSLDMDSAA